MSIRDLASHTTKAGAVTAAWIYEEADTVVVQHECVHISFYKDDFRVYAETLSEALMALEGKEGAVTPLRVVPILKQ